MPFGLAGRWLDPSCLLRVAGEFREVWCLVDDILVFRVVDFRGFAWDRGTDLKTGDDMVGLVEDLDAWRDVDVDVLDSVELNL